jgi:hypothetical protein
MEPEVSLLESQEFVTRPYHEPVVGYAVRNYTIYLFQITK